jgi:hypothetical protein
MLNEDIDRITTWLEGQFPDHDIEVTTRSEAIDWEITPEDEGKASLLRIPEDYFEREDMGVDQFMDLLERNDFPEMVESEDGIRRIITRNQAGAAEELVLVEF